METRKRGFGDEVYDEEKDRKTVEGVKDSALKLKQTRDCEKVWRVDNNRIGRSTRKSWSVQVLSGNSSVET